MSGSVLTCSIPSADECCSTNVCMITYISWLADSTSLTIARKSALLSLR